MLKFRMWHEAKNLSESAPPSVFRGWTRPTLKDPTSFHIMKDKVIDSNYNNRYIGDSLAKFVGVLKQMLETVQERLKKRYQPWYNRPRPPNDALYGDGSGYSVTIDMAATIDFCQGMQEAAYGVSASKTANEQYVYLMTFERFLLLLIEEVEDNIQELEEFDYTNNEHIPRELLPRYRIVLQYLNGSRIRETLGEYMKIIKARTTSENKKTRTESFREFMETDWQRFGHQKSFEFMREPDNPFQQYAKPFLGSDVEDFGLANSQYEPGRLYHVTTNLRGVMRDRRLKSRLELGTSGLGGGPSNMAPSLVSLTYNYQKAFEIYEGLKFVASVVSNQVPASEIYAYIMHRNDNYYDDQDELSHVDMVLRQYGIPKRLILAGDEQAIAARLDARVKTAKEKYELLQTLEKAILDDNPPIDYDENPYFDPVVGFTAPFGDLQGLNPNNIAIIQVVLRKNAQTSHYTQEAEIRARPEDVAIIRYTQPA